MSGRGTVIRLDKDGGSRTISEDQAKEMHLKETGESLDEAKARIARVLERGVITDRLSVDLPGDLHGEWVPRDPVEIERKKALGFQIDTEHAVSRSLHSPGDASAVVGDVVFMTTSKANKALIDLVKRERFERLHGSFKKKRGPQVEEQSYAAQVERTTGGTVPVIDESSASQVGKEEIQAALEEDLRRAAAAPQVPQQ